MKDSYIIHCDYDDHFKLLTNEELGRLIRDVTNYVRNGVLPQYSKEDRVLNMAFSFMKTNLDIEKQKYIEKCERNRRNGSLGGRPRNPEKPNGYEDNRVEAEKADTDTDTGTDTVTDTVTDTDTGTNKSVCDNNAHANNTSICHLGALFKNESCFRCMKKHKCKLPASPDFKLHHKESFEEYNKRIEEMYEQWCKEREARGESTDIEFFDYDWLNDND